MKNGGSPLQPAHSPWMGAKRRRHGSDRTGRCEPLVLHLPWLVVCAWAQSQPRMSPIGSTPRMSFAEELEMTAALCHSCESVWLNAELPSAVNGDLSECWLGVNTTCWDCRRDYPSSTCSHAYFHSHPAPVSGRFSFCSGHSATNVDEMSSFAWMRVMYAA